MPSSYQKYQMTSKKTIIILEHCADVYKYLEIRNKISKPHIVIATIPDVCWELEKRGINYNGIEIYSNLDTIYSLGMMNYEFLDSFCSKIDYSPLG